jgi:hypothetical protein
MKTRFQHRLEKKIRLMLTKTDWMAINAENIYTDEEVVEIRTFRQALRDCNKDHPRDATKWVLPDAPSSIRPVDLSD